MRGLTGKILARVWLLIPLTAAAALFASNPSRAAAQFSNKIATTPAYIQDGFGPAGDLLPCGGTAYCFPTAASMLLTYLGENGFNQIGPSSPTTVDGLNLVRVMAGLMGTDPTNGTGNNPGLGSAIQVYLAAKGIGTSSYSLTYLSYPTISALASVNQNQTVVELGCGFYVPSGGTYTRSGGHAVALLSQGVNALGQSAPSMLVINNPAPCSFASQADIPVNALQYLNTVPTTGSLTPNGALELDPDQYPGFWGTTRTVVEAATVLTVNASQQSVNNPTPATWTLPSTQVVNLQNGNLAVLAPLQGPGGIFKGDGGILEFEAPNNTTGSNTIVSGTLRSDVAAGQPFGTGSIQLQAGTLQLVPATGSGDVTLTAANGVGKQLTFLYGATLALNRNGDNSLRLSIGGNTNGTTANLVRGSGLAGTLVIAPASGTSELGVSERVVVNGTGGNLPALSNGIVAPYIVAGDNDGSGSGDFLTYGSAGFSKAAYTKASTTPITSAGTNAVFEANAGQTIPNNTTTQVYALKVGPVAVGGGSSSTINVGPQSGGQAGVILNGGTISTTNLNFGSAEGVIYTSQAGGTISSAIKGSGGLTTFGPGALLLTGSNSYTGTTTINSGALVAANTFGSATGSGAIAVEQNATLQISGAWARAGGSGGTTVNSGATLLFDGGMLAGPLTMNSGSYLLGNGTIGGPATISGTIGSSATDPAAAPYAGVEHIVFAGSSTWLSSIAYSWRLNALDNAPADAGENWSLLDFATAGAQLGIQNNPLHVTLDLGSGLPDPNSGNAFWSQSHQWLIAEAPNLFSGVWYSWSFPSYRQGYFSLDSEDFRVVHISYTPTLLPGDANGDGTVNGADLDIVLSNYNKTGMTWAQGDFDGNGTVNGIDLNTVLSNYNQSEGVTAAVPEPSTCVLICVGAISVLVWRRRSLVRRVRSNGTNPLRHGVGRPNSENRPSPRKTGGAKNGKKLPAHGRSQPQEDFPGGGVGHQDGPWQWNLSGRIGAVSCDLPTSPLR